MVSLFGKRAQRTLIHILQALTTTTPKEVAMATSKILTNPDRHAVEKPTQYTITKKEFKKLQEIHGQLIALSELVDEVERFSPLPLLLSPIVKNFDSISPEEIGGAA